MKFWQYAEFWILLNSGTFFITFGILAIVFLAIFKWLFKRKENNNSIKHESLIIFITTIFLVISMVMVALSGLYMFILRYGL